MNNDIDAFTLIVHTYIHIMVVRIYKYINQENKELFKTNKIYIKV